MGNQTERGVTIVEERAARPRTVIAYRLIPKVELARILAFQDTLLLRARKRCTRAKKPWVEKFAMECIVEGTKVDNLILDTRAARIIVHSRLVPSCKVTKKKVLIWSVHGDAVRYPLARVCRMPFGLQGAPATFQRMMDSLLAEKEEFSGMIYRRM